jgi:hypothetical protein
MATTKIAALLVLTALANAGANSASAQGLGFPDGSVYGPSYNGTRPPAPGGGYIGPDGYGNGGGYGSGGAAGNDDTNAPGNGNGSGSWYGISPAHTGCPLFRQRVLTPDGERIQMVPVC